jgi:hypothetical protein
MAENGNPDELTTRQRKAVACLLSERNALAAAKAAGVGERTLFRWLADPVFRVAVREAEADAIDTASRRLVGLSDTAIDTLAGILTDEETAPALKLRAAQAILDHLLKLRELATVEARLAALEAAQAARGQRDED